MAKIKVKYYKPIVNKWDYQTRIYRNDYPRIKWEGKVHERIVGNETFTQLPPEEFYCLNHSKTIEKQEKQNSYYDTL